MNPPRELVLELLSDTTFGRGEGLAGEVDVDVEHDELGLPFLGGKTLHGLLRDTWLSMADVFPELAAAALGVLGPEGDLKETAILRVGDAILDPVGVRPWIEHAVRRESHSLLPTTVLRAFTGIRRQTAQNRESGAPARGTLRASRVIRRGLTFHASLHWSRTPDALELRCLALCALGTRHAGLGRNRGRGHVRVTVDGDLSLTHRHAREEPA